MSDRGPNRMVRGRIVLPSGVVPSVATVRVLVEDVSRADAPSAVVAEQRLVETAMRPGMELPFALEVPEARIDPRRRYSVRVHISVDGSGVVRRGDLLSPQSHPILTLGHGDSARVPVRIV